MIQTVPIDSRVEEDDFAPATTAEGAGLFL